VRAMILAAGKGERMLPLTKEVPKPMLMVGDKPLIQYHLEAFALARITEIIINTGQFGEKIEEYLGNGSKFGLEILYSHEGIEPLGTGGGVNNALSLLGNCPFILVNGDVWTNFDFSTLKLKSEYLAHIVLVKNPVHQPQGDFALNNDLIIEKGLPMLTFTGIGVYQPCFFQNAGEQKFSFIPALRQAIRQNKITGEYYEGEWMDIGTPERLLHINDIFKA
jgi:N-acetyl-alpha-D-muramate 1-phosphate uridylyltransferase